MTIIRWICGFTLKVVDLRGLLGQDTWNLLSEDCWDRTHGTSYQLDDQEVQIEMSHLLTLNQLLNHTFLTQSIETPSVKPYMAEDILIEDLHIHAGATVRISNQFSRCFATISGVRRGCVLAALFLVCIDWILNHLEPDVGTTIRQHHFTDDAAISCPMRHKQLVLNTIQSYNPIKYTFI